MQEITLNGQTWKLDINDVLGRGSFGTVFGGLSPTGEPAALKIVPAGPLSDRERLVAPGLSGRKNVLPILAHGEWGDKYVLAMPRANRSLRDVLVAMNGAPMAMEDAAPILQGILSGLDAIGGEGARDTVVHRDLKPDNVLEYKDEWCVADFGIARYVDATTGTHTAKFDRTAAYASPEQWRGDRTEPSTDIYSWAVMAVEMLTGRLPFEGPGLEEFKEQHLLAEPPALREMPDSLAALLKTCLLKPPTVRPTAAEVLSRLVAIDEEPSTPILDGLDRIERREVEHQAADIIREARAVERAEHRKALAKVAADELDNVVSALWGTLKRHMPTIVEDPVFLSASTRQPVYLIKHRDVEVYSAVAYPVDGIPWHHIRPAFDVIAVSAIVVQIPTISAGQTGTDRELWFCNPAGDGRYSWYEMGWSFTNERDNTVAWHDPKVLEPSHSYQLLMGADLPWAVSIPLTPIDVTEFVEQWCGIIEGAFNGVLPQHWLTLSPRSNPGIFLLTDGEQ